MKTIILATDFSPSAMNAANYAADMALSVNAELLLLHIYQTPVIYYEIPVALTKDSLLVDSENFLHKLREQLKIKTNGKLSVHAEVRTGVFFQELKEVCERVNPYTVIMGSQGTTAADRLIFGSHTVYAMQNLTWPLIAVPSNAKFSSIKKIGLACDFDNVVDTIPLDEIKSMVNDFKAELHVINTGKNKEYKPEIVFESGMLQELLAPLKPEYHLITHDNTDEGIMNFAEKNDFDLLIIIPKRHTLMEKLVHKSHTKNLVLHSHVPVISIHH
ncbi:universal stress protein [Daejeonella oryzae]|uniref:universal stress protein n=1 Tax=Daejeonella oryzae TaxID=1122943 RepID=UPI000407D40A|nr:universal stress protein [Daejeonella oryzae]